MPKIGTVLPLLVLALTACGTAQKMPPPTFVAQVPSPTPATVLPSPAPTTTPSCTGATPQPSKGSVPAEVEFLDKPFRVAEGTEWMSPQLQSGLTLGLQGIYAVDEHIAFVFGSFNVGAGSVGSVLLRTGDGGAHWKQVMPAVGASDVTHVVFIEHGEGWAVVSWTLEGPLGATLWHTTDYGQSWREIGRPPIDSAEGIFAFDKTHLQVEAVSWWASPTDHYAILDSNDGGRTWTETYRIALNENNLDAVRRAYAGVPGGHYGSYFACQAWWMGTGCEAFGQDGSHWQAQTISETQCTNGYPWHRPLYTEVRRTLLAENSRYTIPVNYIIDDDKLQTVP